MTAKDPTLWGLAAPAIKDALRKISDQVVTAKKIGKYSALPTLEETPQGNFHQFGTNYRTLDYRKVFELDGKYRTSPHAYSEIEGYAGLLEYVFSKPRYAAFHGWDGDESDELGKRMVKFGTIDLVIEIAARHAHERGLEFDDDYAFARFLEMEAWWQGGNLPIQLVIPIVGISFENDLIQLSEEVEIARISDSDHLARVAGLQPYQRDAWLIRACTHAIVINDGSCINWPRSMGREEWNGFPYETVDQVIQAVSIATTTPTGYHQICYLPTGWSPGYTEKLGLLRHAFTVTRESQKLDPSVESPSTTLDSAKASDVAQLYKALVETNPQASLAARRLQLASLRTDELDEIVDLCVGIEALLGGTQVGDTTYKLAVRGAAVLARIGFMNSARIADLIKKVYAYRSYIVHGQVKHEKKRLVAINGEKHPATGIAQYILTQLLGVMLKNPTLLDEIDDDKVIFSLIDEWSARSTDSPTSTENDQEIENPSGGQEMRNDEAGGHEGGGATRGR
ncbi:hypothetical protein [Streptomyces sp. NPDC002769]|uniref:hypothetical protein n=1 Tax=Streptomyces sp. NPDC002769 TaxID=3154542 RepID=UPI003325CA5D